MPNSIEAQGYVDTSRSFVESITRHAANGSKRKGA
jgi:hypothetical protein